MDLADRRHSGCQQRQKIAVRQGISVDFMDHIIARLKVKGLITSIRGRFGGLVLEKDPSEISLWDIFEAVEDHIYPVKCIKNHDCILENQCISYDVWQDAFTSIKKDLSNKFLATFVEKWQLKKSLASQSPALASELGCQAPNKKPLFQDTALAH